MLHSAPATAKLKKGNLEDGTRQELILKYFAYINNRKEFDGKVSDFLNKYIKSETARLKSFTKFEAEFEKICAMLTAATEGPITRPGVGWTPQNQFEGILVAAGELLLDKVKEFKPKAGWLADSDLIKFSTGGTNTKTMLEGRIKRAKELLQGDTVKTNKS